MSIKTIAIPRGGYRSGPASAAASPGHSDAALNTAHLLILLQRIADRVDNEAAGQGTPTGFGKLDRKEGKPR
jgi:hypothetical protein